MKKQDENEEEETGGDTLATTTIPSTQADTKESSSLYHPHNHTPHHHEEEEKQQPHEQHVDKDEQLNPAASEIEKNKVSTGTIDSEEINTETEVGKKRSSDNTLDSSSHIIHTSIISNKIKSDKVQKINQVKACSDKRGSIAISQEIEELEQVELLLTGKSPTQPKIPEHSSSKTSSMLAHDILAPKSMVVAADPRNKNTKSKNSTTTHQHASSLKSHKRAAIPSSPNDPRRLVLLPTTHSQTNVPYTIDSSTHHTTYTEKQQHQTKAVVVDDRQQQRKGVVVEKNHITAMSRPENENGGNLLVKSTVAPNVEGHGVVSNISTITSSDESSIERGGVF